MLFDRKGNPREVNRTVRLVTDAPMIEVDGLYFSVANDREDRAALEMALDPKQAEANTGAADTAKEE